MREAEKLTSNANRATRERVLEQRLSDLTLPSLLVKTKSGEDLGWRWEKNSILRMINIPHPRAASRKQEGAKYKHTH